VSRAAVAAGGLLLLAATSSDVVRVAASAPIRLAPGASAAIAVGVSIRDGFKVQANPAADEYLVPLLLELGSSREVSVVGTDYPEAVRYRLRGAESDLLVYEGEISLLIRVRAGPEAPPGRARLDGRLHFQACNSRTCLRPDAVPLGIEVEVAAAPEGR